MLAETIVPWVLGALLSLTLLMFVSCIKAWREMKRSPYFFMRRQAEKRLQTYSSISLVLLVMSVGFVTYAWRPSQAQVHRVALLTNTKPPQDEIVALLGNSRTQAAAAETAVADSLSITEALRLEGTDLPSARPQLPPEFDRFEPTAALHPDTSLGSILFSREISANFEPRSAARIFPEGYYTLYATFSYVAMADGMEWAWVWKHNGRVVDGGNELWRYGADGPGYIYFGPEEGFQPGEYVLEVWVNGELMTASSAVMNNAAFSAGN